MIKNKLIQSMTFAMPYVHELMSPLKPIAVDTQVLDVLSLFDIYSELQALAIQDNNDCIGIISRYHYLYQTPRAVITQLFAHSSLKMLLANDHNIFSIALAADVDDRIDQIVLELLTFDLRIEVLPVKNKHGVIGIVKITDLTLKLFEIQTILLNHAVETSARLKNEVEVAAILQRNLLRIGDIDLLGVRGLSTLITSSEIGGDFYDYYAIDARWLIILIGDVSGHGIASGTIVSVAKATVSLLEIDREKEPNKILERLNKTIIKTARQSLLMTLFVLCLDTYTGELCYANAGHQFPYIYRSAQAQLDKLEEAAGFPLGRQENITYEQYSTIINLGDRLFIYTDALVEEENPAGDCFGYDRLEAVLNEHIQDAPDYLRDVLLERFTSHVEHCDFNDDVTMVHIEFYQRGGITN